MTTPARRYTRIGASAAAVIALATTLTIQREGNPGARDHHPAYFDKIGRKWTICNGHTGADVHQGQVATDAECDSLRAHDEGDAYGAVHRCITIPMPLGVDGALTDAVYNIGPKVVCGSTIQREAYLRHWQAVCDQLYRWSYAHGVFIKGLWNGRDLEYRQACIEGVPLPALAAALTPGTARATNSALATPTKKQE